LSNLAGTGRSRSSSSAATVDFPAPGAPATTQTIPIDGDGGRVIVHASISGSGDVDGTLDMMSTASRRSFPVTTTHLPLVRCNLCRKSLAHRRGAASEVLTTHYQREHPEALASRGHRQNR
jgi:hypothetical protein